jgi:hypothetical protein
MFDDELYDDEATVLGRAESILAHATLVVHEEYAVESLRGTIGVAFAPLFVEAPVIHAVTVDGVRVGRVRRLNPHHWPERWVAVPLHGHPSGCFESAAEAAEALAMITAESERWTP